MHAPLHYICYIRRYYIAKLLSCKLHITTNTANNMVTYVAHQLYTSPYPDYYHSDIQLISYTIRLHLQILDNQSL